MDYTANELMCVSAARCLKDGMTVAVGIGLPQMACFLAKMTHAPNLNLFYEHGVYNPAPKDGGIGLADPRAWYGSMNYTGFTDAAGQIFAGGHVDVGFLGALQCDKYGNLNSTMVKKADGGVRHFTGSGGAADIAAMARRVFVIMRHERRKLVEKCDYITSVGGYRDVTVFTNLCILQTGGESGVLELKSLHPGVTLDEVRENTGFELVIPPDYAITPEPDEKSLALLRQVLDPGRLYIQ